MPTVEFNKLAPVHGGLEFELQANDLVLEQCNGFGSGTVRTYLVLAVRGTPKRPGSVATVVRIDSWTPESVSYSDSTPLRTIRKARGNSPVWLFEGDSARDRIYDIWLTSRPRIDNGYMK